MKGTPIRNEQASAGRSRPVRSGQETAHRTLDAVVRRHARASWRQPLHAPSVQAFRRTQELLRGDETGRLVLDAGCGTGDSTRRLADLHPRCVVLGVDRSAHRLARSGGQSWPEREGRIVRVRAELTTFWRLADAAGWRLSHHYLLYPNPWPKPAHLRRRWHAHPVFPLLLRLGGVLELRCNWDVYALEFARAAELLTGRPQRARPLHRPDGLSPFERKYAASGHELWRVRVDLTDQGERDATL